MILPFLSALLFLASVLVAVLMGFEVPSWSFVLVGILLFKRPAVAVLLFAILLGFWRVESYESQAPENPPVGEWVSLEGRVAEEVDARSDHQKITVETEEGRVLVKLGLYEEVGYGDWVRVEGTLERPYEGEDFSYGNYLARCRTWLVMNRASVEVLWEGKTGRGTLYAFKDFVQRRINQLYFEPEASFVSGLLLGSRKGMPEDLTLAFQKVGLTHIVAVSGYNISLVIAVIFALLSFLPFKRRIWASVLAVILFVIFVGASSAAVRAGFMGCLTMWGLYAGRRSQAYFALLWSAVGMTLWNPYILVYDIGFQLSVLSTFGLLTLVPILDARVPKWEKGKFLREGFLLTLSAQVATFPLMVFYFGRISLVAPIVNVLVAPFIPLSMLFSAASLALGLPAAAVANFYLELIEWITIVFAKLPFADTSLKFGAMLFALSLVLFFGGIIFFYRSILVRAFGLQGAAIFSKVRVPQFERRETQ